MTNHLVWFVFKILLGSTLLSLLIKYGFGSLNISSSNAAALIIVLLPAGSLAIALAWRKLQSQIGVII
jgi:hypothetical protein